MTNVNAYDPRPSERLDPPYQGRPGVNHGPRSYESLREIWSAAYLTSLGIHPRS